MDFWQVNSFEVATLSPDESGLPCFLSIDSVGAERGNSVLPVCWIWFRNEHIPISICEHPEILGVATNIEDDYAGMDEVFGWIAARRETLLRHWRKELSDLQALNMLVPN